MLSSKEKAALDPGLLSALGSASGFPPSCPATSIRPCRDDAMCSQLALQQVATDPDMFVGDP